MHCVRGGGSAQAVGSGDFLKSDRFLAGLRIRNLRGTLRSWPLQRFCSAHLNLQGTSRVESSDPVSSGYCWYH